MKRYLLTEDNPPQKLSTNFSKEILQTIQCVENYNQNNIEGINQWKNYLNGMLSYIANPAIAWNYANDSNVRKLANDTYLNYNFDYNIYYKIYTTPQKAYVYIFRANLNEEEFGLVDPSNMSESRKKVKKLRLTESEFHTLISECVKKILKQVI